jgi:hypothetical protein
MFALMTTSRDALHGNRALCQAGAKSRIALAWRQAA